MNIAVATITLIFLLAPGLFFWRFYYSGVFSQQYFKTTFTDIVIPTVIPSVLIHVLLYFAVVNQRFQINLKVLGTLFSGTSNPAAVEEAFQNIYDNAKLIFWYFLVACFVAALLGTMSRVLVRRWQLDRKYHALRFQNEWHYLFSGEILDFPNPNAIGSSSNINLIIVDALVDTKEGSVIYSGTLTHYVLNKEGGIDRIYLADVRRRHIKDDRNKLEETTKDVYYDMPGNLFVILFKNVINLNINYYTLEIEDLALTTELSETLQR